MTVEDVLQELLALCPVDDWSVKRQEYVKNTGNHKTKYVSWEIHNHSQGIGFSTESTAEGALAHVRQWKEQQ